jgi:predicted flap endonuclease-1-like 5' DNA nuclease
MASVACGLRFVLSGGDEPATEGLNMASKTVVLAFFNDEPTADDAVEALKAWDKADDYIKLDAIGVLALNDKGKIKTHKLGKRSVGKGAGIGLVLAVIAPPTLLAGVIGGGILGAFHHKGLGLKAADRDRIASQLSAGQAAVGVLVNPDIAIDISAKLTELGGSAEVHEVTEEAVAEVETAVPAVEAAEMAAGDDLSILDGVGPKYADALRAGGVTTFAQLSQMTPEAIEGKLSDANEPLIAGHNADTWPRQAKLAANQEWSALRRYIDSTKKVAAG